MPAHDHDHDPDGGLTRDLPGLLGRRRLLGLLGGATAVVLAGCASDDGSTAATPANSATTAASSASTDAAPATTAGPAATTAATEAPAATGAPATTAASVDTTAADLECSTIPQETAGPFPGDGSNGPDVLTDSGAVRSDITSSFGTMSGVAGGIPLTINLVVVDTADGCTPMAGAAVYVWHCDREGRYSLYSDGATDENYCRGVQETAADGRATFQSIFPGAYLGRWPHVHFEIYPSLAAAAKGSHAAITTSQIALPPDVCETVYSTAGYEASVRNFAQTSLQSDMVFGDDGGVRQLPTSSGSVDSGLSVELTVPV